MVEIYGGEGGTNRRLKVGGFQQLERYIPVGLKAAEINFFNSDAACGILCEEKEALSPLEGQDANRY